MGADEDSIWLIKVNPKLLEFLDRLLRMMEQTPVMMQTPVPQQEEKSRREDNLPEGLLTVDEAAQRLRVSKHTLRTWISQRRVSYVKIGRRTLFNPSDLDNLIKSCTVGPRKGRGSY